MKSAAGPLVLCLLSSPCPAELPPVSTTVKTPYGDFEAWGIASQGYAWTDRHSFFGSEEDPFGYREISLGGQYKFLDRYSLTVQGEYRDAGRSDDLGLRLSQAYADGNFSPAPGTIMGMNAGRIEPPFGLYNRTRDRVDTRPSIVLPQSIYFEGLGLRDYLLTGDGMMVYGLYQTSKKSRMETKMAMVRSSYGDIAGLEDAPLVTGWMDYVWDDALRLRMTMLYSGQEETQLTFPVLSAQYLWDRWTFTSEWGRAQLDTPQGSLGTDGVYGQVEYAVNERFTLFGRYDYFKFTLDTPVPIAIPEDLLRSQGFVAGFGWNVTQHLRLNAEYHWAQGTAWLNGRENPGLGVNGGDDWDMLMLMASFRF